MTFFARAAGLATVAGVLSTVSTAVQADNPALQHLKCTFAAGNSWSYDAGTFSSKPSTPLAFEISAINLEAQSATLIIDAKQSGVLKIVRALNANSYLEVANEGFLNLTTVYDFDPAAKSYPAVHSRHFGLMGQPVFAQYTGSCVAG